MDEIKNPVPAGIHPRNQIRPCHRTLRRNAGGKLAKRPPLRQRRKVRHLSFRHKTSKQLRIHAINAQHNQLLVAVPFLPLARKKRSQSKTQPQPNNNARESIPAARQFKVDVRTMQDRDSIPSPM